MQPERLSSVRREFSPSTSSRRTTGLLLWLFFLSTAGPVLAQSTSIDYPYQRQSVVSGAQLPVRIRVTPPAGFSITEVRLTRNSGGGSTTAVIGTSTTPSSSTNTFSIPWSVSLAQSGAGGFLELATSATCTNGASTSVLTSTRLVTVIADNACNTGANVKSFYLQAGASTATTAGLGESSANPSGSFNKIINNGVLIGGSTVRPLPGDIIYVMNGIDAGSGPQSYTRTDATTGIDLFAMIRTGTPGCPITITNFSGTPKLKATSAINNAIFIPPGISYVNISGLEIEGLYTDAQLATTLPLALTQNGSCRDDGTLRAGTAPFNFNGSGITIDGRNGAGANPHHINITNNIIHNCSGGGVGAIEADYVTIEKNTIYNNAWYTVYGSSGISIFHPWNFDGNAGYRNYIRNNKCYGNRLYVKWNVGCKITDGNGIILDDFPNSQASSTIRYQEYTGKTLVANNLTRTMRLLN